MIFLVVGRRNLKRPLLKGMGFPGLKRASPQQLLAAQRALANRRARRATASRSMK